MIKLNVGELYNFNYSKSIPPMIKSGEVEIYSNYEYVGKKKSGYHFYDWNDGSDKYLTTEQVKLCITITDE